MRQKDPRMLKLLTGYPDDRPREQNVWPLMNALSMHRPDRFYCPVDEDDQQGRDLFIPILCRYNHSLKTFHFQYTFPAIKPFPQI